MSLAAGGSPKSIAGPSRKEIFEQNLVQRSIQQGVSIENASHLAGALALGVQLSENGVVQDLLNGVTAVAMIASMREIAEEVYDRGGEGFFEDLRAAVAQTQSYKEYLQDTTGLMEKLSSGYLDEVQTALCVRLNAEELLEIADSYAVARMDGLVSELRTMTFDSCTSCDSAESIAATERVVAIAMQMRKVISE